MGEELKINESRRSKGQWTWREIKKILAAAKKAIGLVRNFGCGIGESRVEF